MNIYNVTYLRDESQWWVASIREVPGCHSQGRTIDEAQRRVGEALELFVDDAKSATLVDQESNVDL
jgi:predicted RNase H-like HicB family nuclease